MSESTATIQHEKIWTTFLESFRQRRWNAIRSTWPRFLSQWTDVAGPPPITISDLLELGGILTDLPGKGKVSEIHHPRGEVPELVFREAVFWMHKALHVLGAAEAHVESGLQTWSLSSAYQCAYFAARSILSFLGVSVAEVQRISVAVDLCRDMQGIRPNRMGMLGAFEEDIAFRSTGVLLDHRQVWQLFQRVLRVSSCDVWPDDWAKYLSNVEIGVMTKQRHGLHYQLKYWVVDDLHQFVHAEEFWRVEPTGDGRTLIDSQQNNYSLQLGMMLSRMALRLFYDLSEQTNRLVQQRETVIAAVTGDRHPFFSDILRQEIRAATETG